MFEAGGGEFVLAIEVGGDGEEAIGFEGGEGVGVELGPDGDVVPEILMTDEDEVEGRELLHAVGVGGVADTEVEVPFVGGGGDPAGAGFVDLGGAEVDAKVEESGGGGGEVFEEDAGFIGATAGEVKNGGAFRWFPGGGLQGDGEQAGEALDICVDTGVAERFGGEHFDGWFLDQDRLDG